MNRVFARYPSLPDPRDRRHLLRPQASARTFRYWTEGPIQDQGDQPNCVGQAWAGWLAGAPIRQWLDPHGLYQLAQHYDEWEGTAYTGTSVRGGAKVLHALGFLVEYQWARSIESLVYALLERGPVVVGTEWLSGMMTTDSQGMIHVSGASQGGHAYVLTGVNTSERLFRLRNSWGASWGVGGRAWIGFDDFAALLQRRGEACLAVEKRPAQ